MTMQMNLVKLKEVLFVVNLKLFREYVAWEFENKNETDEYKFNKLVEYFEIAGSEFSTFKMTIKNFLR